MILLDVEFEDDALLLSELARRLDLELKPFFDGYMRDGDLSMDDFYSINRLGSFVYIFNRFPERMMIPTIYEYDLEMTDINKTYGSGVHLIGLNNDYMEADGALMSPFEFLLHDVSHSVRHHNDNNDSSELDFIDVYDSYGNSHTRIENFPELLRSFMQESYFELTHELGARLAELIERYQQQQRQILFPLLQKLGDLTASEELEFKKAILLLNYFELPESLIVFDGENVFLDIDIEFTEENVKDKDIFAKLILKLYLLYEGQLTLPSN